MGSMSMPQHTPISPAILYWGTPVVLVSTLNEDNTPNIGPMSSAWWLGTNCMLGLAAGSCTTNNILRTGECTLNLASDDMTTQVNAIAKTTGTDPVPAKKAGRGYVHCKDKFGTANLTEMESKIVKPFGIQECPVSMEAKLVGIHEMFGNKSAKGGALAIEVEIVRVTVHEHLRKEGYENRVEGDRWKPMIMMFSNFYGLKDGKLVHSRLADIEEESYRMAKEPEQAETQTAKAGAGDWRVQRQAL